MRGELHGHERSTYASSGHASGLEVGAALERLSAQASILPLYPLAAAPVRVDVTTRGGPALRLLLAGFSGVAQGAAPGTRGDEHVFVGALLGGTSRGWYGRRRFELRSGEAIVAACGAPGFGLEHAAPSRLLGLRLPRQSLLPLVPDLERVLGTVIAAHDPALRLLTTYVLAALGQEALGLPGYEPTLARHATDLIALALGADAARASDPARSVRAARLLALQAYVMAHLHEQSLDVRSVAAHHRITPRYVHLLFAGTGSSFSAYVLGQRLEHAHRRLSDARFDHLSISAVAFDVGFRDLSHFNRSFRRRFAQTPSELRASRREAAAQGSS